MTLPLKQSALAIIAGALAAATQPAPPIAPSAWAGQQFVLPDGERKGELIDLSFTPHLIEPLDALGPDSPDNEVAVMKSGQSAFTTLLQNVVGYYIDRDPCDLMVVQPTDSALSDFNSQKIGRAIDSSRDRGLALKEKTWGVKVRPQTSRAGTASTTYEKKFPGGACFLALASSAADLRSKTIKIALCDEVDEYPDDLAEQGDPLDMVAARQISFLRSGAWKRGYFSTPRIKGVSKIERKYLAGDQRRWHVRCPGCDERFVLEWNAPYDDRVHGLKFNRTYPYNAHYVPPCCGAPVSGEQKFAVYKTGIWVATAKRPGAYKSYHFDALASPFVPWNDIAKAFVEAGDDRSNLKTFWNLWLGLPFEEKGDAPDHIKLLQRVEDYPEGHVPAEGLLLTCGADVQHTGIWYSVEAYAPDKQSWNVRFGFIAGDTTDPAAGAFLELDKLLAEKFPDAFDGFRLIDAMAIDAGDGGRFNQVCAWATGRHRAFAIKGRPGWTTPAVGTPAKVFVTLKGRKRKGAAQLWPIGTWPLKATYYDNLRKEGRRDGAEIDPAGFCHHHKGCDERFFKQRTAEYLKQQVVRGRLVRAWTETGPNHLLDCRIYADAMADMLGLSRMTPTQWAALRQERGVPAQIGQPDLLAPAPVRIAARPTLIGRPKRRRRLVWSRGIG